MSRQVVEKILGMVVLVVGLLVVVGCAPGELNPGAFASSAPIAPEARALSDSASVALWEGLGESYLVAAAVSLAKARTAETNRAEAMQMLTLPAGLV